MARLASNQTSGPLGSYWQKWSHMEEYHTPVKTLRNNYFWRLETMKFWDLDNFPWLCMLRHILKYTYKQLQNNFELNLAFLGSNQEWLIQRWSGTWTSFTGCHGQKAALRNFTRSWRCAGNKSLRNGPLLIFYRALSMISLLPQRDNMRCIHRWQNKKKKRKGEAPVST